MRLLDWILLLPTAALLGMSLLAVFRAPNMPAFFLAVGATELGAWFAVGALALAVGAAGPVSAPLLVAAALFLSGPVRAARAAPRLAGEVARSFGGAPRPFRWRDLLRFPRGHRATGERHTITAPAGPLGFDFYRARSGSPAPLVVIAHGGGWMAGDSGELAAWNPWLTARGYAVASVDYRLVPEASWPEQIDEVLATIDHLRRHAAEFGVDPERIVLLGRSAGGQIVSAIAAPGEHPWLRGCVCLYAPFDMVFAYAHGRDDDALRSRWLLRSYLGGTPEERPDAYHFASAFQTVTPASPPFLLLHGERDELVWVAQSERFAARLGELGVPHALLRLPWATHAFDYNLHGPGGQVLASALETFLAAVCAPKPAPVRA